MSTFGPACGSTGPVIELFYSALPQLLYLRTRSASGPRTAPSEALHVIDLLHLKIKFQFASELSGEGGCCGFLPESKARVSVNAPSWATSCA